MTTGTSEHPPVEELPAAAWWLGWSFLVGQVVDVVQRGFQDESAWPLSILLAVALVVFFAHGVLRARMVRTVIVGVLLGLAALVELFAVLTGDVGEVLGLAFTALQLTLFVTFVRTPWFAWQRTRPAGGPSLAPLLWIAVAVGVLGGLLGASADTGGAGFNVEINV